MLHNELLILSTCLICKGNLHGHFMTTVAGCSWLTRQNFTGSTLHFIKNNTNTMSMILSKMCISSLWVLSDISMRTSLQPTERIEDRNVLSEHRGRRPQAPLGIQSGKMVHAERSISSITPRRLGSKDGGSLTNDLSLFNPRPSLEAQPFVRLFRGFHFNSELSSVEREVNRK